ncbi:MAG: helix-turn-helix domain-containing protein [Gammaproteobacteria bacterium]|nr:helix-turn-helix domain-containing protein [Gammaproteobacteria bacterium]
MARGYGQFCPVAKAAEVFCERWNALLLRELGAGSTHFADLQRGVPLMSPSTLSRRLRELEREGVIERRRSGAAGSWTYHLTPAGEEFLPLVEALGIWGRRWSRRELDEGEVDLQLLLWDMERTVRGDAFGAGRSVVQLELTDQPRSKRLWWFVNDDGRTQVCIDDPGFEVDLYLSATLVDMVHVWRGDVPLADALEHRRLRAHGATHLVRALGRWLTLSHFAGVEPARGDAGRDRRDSPGDETRKASHGVRSISEK